MSILSAILLGLAMGVVFGFVLEKSRVFEPGMILGQMQMRNFIMLKIFVTAVMTDLVILAVMSSLGIVTMHPKATLMAADVIGGLLLGAGITIAGACPGTVAAQIGAGYRDSWAILAGGLLGAIAFSYLEPVLKPLLLTGGPGKLTLDVAMGVPFPLVALALALALMAILIGLERMRPWTADLGRNFDGLDTGAQGGVGISHPVQQYR